MQYCVESCSVSVSILTFKEGRKTTSQIHDTDVLSFLENSVWIELPRAGASAVFTFSPPLFSLYSKVGPFKKYLMLLFVSFFFVELFGSLSSSVTMVCL